MKKSMAVIIIVVAFVIGFLVGSHSVLTAPKWVIETSGVQVICTEFFGHLFEDISTRESEIYDSLVYGRINK